jgi:hypothetical protein
MNGFHSPSDSSSRFVITSKNSKIPIHHFFMPLLYPRAIYNIQRSAKKEREATTWDCPKGHAYTEAIEIKPFPPLHMHMIYITVNEMKGNGEACTRSLGKE